MFRKMTTILGIAALVACSACNNVTGPASSDEQTISSKRVPIDNPPQPQIDPTKKVELGDPGDGGGGSEPTLPVKEDSRRGTVRNGQITPSKVELGDPGHGGGGGGTPQPVKLESGRGTVRNGQVNP